jgi:peptide/nickel transport system ATP-binding protein
LTYLMVSHDLPVIGHMCERLAVMKDGEIVEVMDVAALREMRAGHPYSQSLLAASVAG